MCAYQHSTKPSNTSPPALGLQVLDRRPPGTDAAPVLGHCAGSSMTGTSAAQHMGGRQLKKKKWQQADTPSQDHHSPIYSEALPACFLKFHTVLQHLLSIRHSMTAATSAHLRPWPPPRGP